jgi:predicted MFS family arabinose efflux permease
MDSQNPVFKTNIYMVILVIIMATQIIPIDVGWGYLEVYIASYLYSFSDSITTSKVHMLLSVIEIGQMLGAQIFHLVISRLGYREGISLALVLMATGMLICSISITIWGFIIPAVLFGIADALRCLICSFFMVELMPENYALAAGLGNIGGPFALLFWSWTPLQVVNPNNASPDIEITEVTRTAYYFGEAVISKVPYLFQVVMLIAIVASF